MKRHTTANATMFLTMTTMSTTTTTVMAQSSSVDPCFQDNIQLRNAVVEYAVDSSAASEVAGKHGWPIGDWCVGNVTDFHDIFYRVDINEDISDWDVSSAVSLSNMFGNNTAFNQDVSAWVRIDR